MWTSGLVVVVVVVVVVRGGGGGAAAAQVQGVCSSRHSAGCRLCFGVEQEKEDDFEHREK